MEIIRKKSGAARFRVLKPFQWGGFIVEVGQELNVANDLALQMISQGKIEPVDVPLVGAYYCLTEVVQPGKTEGFRAKALEKVILKREQAIDLMLKRMVIPVDPAQWKPFQITLRRPGTPQHHR